jgi:hypothetical protein
VGPLNRHRERAEQLAQLLEGALAPDDAAADLRGLATLAGSVTDQVARPTLDDDTRERMRARILAEVRTDLLAEADTTTVRARRRGAVALATGLVSVVVGAAGVAVAAQGALPGDALYDVKQATESVRVAAAGDLAAQGRLELTLAEERLAEVVAAVDRGDVRDEVLIDTLARMDVRSRDGAATLVQVAEREADAALLDEVAAFTERQATGLVEVFGDLPVTVRPHAEDSLALVRAIRTQLLEPVLGGDGSTSAAQVGEIEQLLRSATLPPGPAESEAETGDESRGGGETDTTTTTTPTRPADAAPESPSPAGGSTRPDAGELETPREDRDRVPPLPDPVDDVGDAVDDTIDGVLDGADEVVEDTRRGVDEVVDGAGDTVDDAVDGVDGVDGVVDGAGDTLDESLGGVGGRLGGGRDGD